MPTYPSSRWPQDGEESCVPLHAFAQSRERIPKTTPGGVERYSLRRGGLLDRVPEHRMQNECLGLGVRELLEQLPDCCETFGRGARIRRRSLVEGELFDF